MIPRPIKLTETDTTRFWSKINKHGLNDCWEWLSYKIRDYGGFVSINQHISRIASPLLLPMVIPSCKFATPATIRLAATRITSMQVLRKTMFSSVVLKVAIVMVEVE